MYIKFFWPKKYVNIFNMRSYFIWIIVFWLLKIAIRIRAGGIIILLIKSFPFPHRRARAVE